MKLNAHQIFLFHSSREHGLEIITGRRHHGSVNREDFLPVARHQSHVTKQPLDSELIKALQYNRAVRIAGKKPRSSSLARLQVGRDAHVAVTERHLHGRTRSSTRAAGRRRYKENAPGKRGPAERRALKRSQQQHRSGHADVRPAAAVRTSNLTGERVNHHPRQLRDRFTASERPGLSSFAAALRAGVGPPRPAHPGCRPPRLSTSASSGCVLCDPRWVAAATDWARSRAWNSDVGLERRRPNTDTQPDLPERPNPRIPRARSGCTAIALARLTWQGGGGWWKGSGGTGGGVPPGPRGLWRGPLRKPAGMRVRVLKLAVVGFLSAFQERILCRIDASGLCQKNNETQPLFKQKNPGRGNHCIVLIFFFSFKNSFTVCSTLNEQLN